MTYREVTEEILGKRRFGNLFGVEIWQRMSDMLHNPQEGMRLIHIAGTNGKGSVAAFLCAILREAGIKTGLFTSPHLVDFEERIRVDGRMIDQESVRRIGEQLLFTDFSVQPTMFDYTLAMAFLFFKEQKCEAVVLETGVGGRLDSTNAVGVPEVSVITKVGYDHMEVLGRTLEEIAAEKAGILKEGTAFVTESQTPEVSAVLRRAALRAGVRCQKTVEKSAIRDVCIKGGRQCFSYGTYENLSMGMLGVHQCENAAAAILAAELFLAGAPAGEGSSEIASGDAGGKILTGDRGEKSAPGGPDEKEPSWSRGEKSAPGSPDEKALSGEARGRLTEEEIRSCIRSGIKRALWPGRLEIMRTEPFLLADGAHNSCGAAALAESLAMLFPEEKFHFLMGVMADKDYETMLDLLLPLAIDVTTVTVEGGRALKAEELARLIEKKGVPAYCAKDLPSCLSAEHGDPAHRTVAFGSLYFVGAVRAWMKPDRCGISCEK